MHAASEAGLDGWLTSLVLSNSPSLFRKNTALGFKEEADMRKPTYSRNTKGSSKAQAGGSKEGVVCFVCYDGGTLFLCDRRRCHKAYHPECIGRSRSFFRTKGSWACGRHFCSKCSSLPIVMCIMCATSFCSTCMPSSNEFLPLTTDEGLCESCLEIVKMIELHQNVDKEGNSVDFDDSNTYECLFKEYWQIMKCVRGLELDPHLFKEKGAEEKASIEVELPSVGDAVGLMVEADHKKSELHTGDCSGEFGKEFDNKERDPELLVQVALDNNGFVGGDPTSRQELPPALSTLETVATGEAAMIMEENVEFVTTDLRETVAAGAAAMVTEENVEFVTTARREAVAAGEATNIKEQNVEAGMTCQREMDDERKESGSSAELLSDGKDCNGGNCDRGQEQEHVERLVLLNTKDASSKIHNEGHDGSVGTETDERVLLQMMNCNKYVIEESTNTEVEADDGQKQGFMTVGDEVDMLTATKMSIPFSGESETRFSGVVKKFNACDGKDVTAMESDDKEKDPEMLSEPHLDRQNNLNCCEVGQGELKLLHENITDFTEETCDREQKIDVCNEEQEVSRLPPELSTAKEDCGGQQCTTEQEKRHMEEEENGYGCGRDSKEHPGTSDLEEGPFCNKEQREDDFADSGREGGHAGKEGLLHVSSGDSINESPHHTELGGDGEAHEDLLLQMDNSCKQSNELDHCKEKGNREMEGEYEGKGGFLEYHCGSQSARETICMRYDHSNNYIMDSLCTNCNITPRPLVDAAVASKGLTTNSDTDFVCESSKDALLQEGVSDPSYVCSCSGGDEPIQQEGRSSLMSTIISKDLSQEGVSDPCDIRNCIAGTEPLQQEGSSNLGSTIMSKSYAERDSFTKVDSKGKVAGEGQQINNDVATGFTTNTATHQQALNAMKKVEPVYLSRSQLEELLDDPDFSRKIQAAYVKIRLDEQNYRLVKVNGIILQAEQYQVGNKKTNVLLEVMNANKRQHITVNFVSNQGFTEDEYHGLWQSINSEQKETSTLKRGLEGEAVVQKKQETSECLGAKAMELRNVRDNKREAGCIKEFKRCQEQSENVSSSVYCVNSETQMPMDKQLDVDQVSDISVDRTSFDERDPVVEIEDKKVPFEFLQDEQSAWYYRDLRERIHGPFSMDQLDRWSKTGLFPSDLRIWREDQGPLYSVLLTDALSLWSHSQGRMKTECGQSAADLEAGNVWSRRANNWQTANSDCIRDLSMLEGHLPKFKDGKSTITEGLDQRPAYQMQKKRMSLNGRETSFFRERLPPERKKHQPVVNVEDRGSSEAQMRSVYWTNPGTEEGPDPALNSWSCPDASGRSPLNARDRRAMTREERQSDWTWNCPDGEMEYGWSPLKARDRPGVNRGESQSGGKGGHDGWRFSQDDVGSWNSPDAHCGYGWPCSRTIGAAGEESQSDGKALEDGWRLAQESEEIERNCDWPQLEVRQGAEPKSIWSSCSKQSSVRTPRFYRHNHSVLKSEMDWVDGKYGYRGSRDFNHNRNGHEHVGRSKFSSEVIQGQRRHWKYDDFQRGSQFRSDSYRTRGCRQVIVPARVYDKKRVVHSIHDKEFDRRRQFSKGNLTKDFDFPCQAGRRQTLFCQDQRRSQSPSEWRTCKRSRTYRRDWRDGENRESMSGESDGSWRDFWRDGKASESGPWVSGGCWRDYNEGTEREWFSSSQMSPQFPPPPPPLPAETSNIKHVNRLFDSPSQTD